MQERRDQFAKQYTHVWVGGLSGISSFTFTMPDKRLADNLITKLFESTLIADVTEYNSRVRKTFNKYGKMQLEEGMVQIKGVTSDLRVTELIEAVFEAQRAEHFVAEYDIIIQSISTGSKEYIEWVKLQCTAKTARLANAEGLVKAEASAGADPNHPYMSADEKLKYDTGHAQNGRFSDHQSLDAPLPAVAKQPEFKEETTKPKKKTEEESEPKAKTNSTQSAVQVKSDSQEEESEEDEINDISSMVEQMESTNN